MLALSCPWCRSSVVAGPGPITCPSCGHRADVVRQDCNCHGCRRPASVVPAPGPHCDFCGGKGHVSLGRQTMGCWGCEGVATAGVYVLRVVARGVRYEPRYVTRHHARAVRRAWRWACRLAVRKADTESVSVLYLPLGDRSATPGVLVCNVPTGRRWRGEAVA